MWPWVERLCEQKEDLFTIFYILQCPLMLLAITQQACSFLKGTETDLVGYCKVGQIRTHKLMKGHLMNSYVFLPCARSVWGGTEQTACGRRQLKGRRDNP